MISVIGSPQTGISGNFVVVRGLGEQQAYL
jgi:hypothetical protein